MVSRPSWPIAAGEPAGVAGGRTLKIGILALQGASARHAAAFEGLGVSTLEVRTPADLDGVDALVLPGGESTTIGKLLDAQALFDPLAERLAAGMPALGTCAGMILLASRVLDGRPDQRSLGAVDVEVRRNAFGTQVDSFEAALDVRGLEGGPFHAVFIRAPVVESAGEAVEVLAEVGGRPVLCRQGPVLVSAFHPELVDDPRIHEQFCSIVEHAAR